MKKKLLALSLCSIIAILAITGASLAWLQDTTDTITNTFTYGDINIQLVENSGSSYKMVPGDKIAKDPKITVETGSEDCWLFVKIEKSANYSTYLEDYILADGWIALAGQTGVYYREAVAGNEFNVLANGGSGYENGYVQVKTSVNKTQMEAIKSTGMPTLSFTAYAVQKSNVTTASDAWNILFPPSNT